MELLLHQRIQTRCGLVEDHKRRSMEQGLYQTDLLFVPPGQLTHGWCEIEFEPVGQGTGEAQIVDPAQTCEEAV